MEPLWIVAAGIVGVALGALLVQWRAQARLQASEIHRARLEEQNAAAQSQQLQSLEQLAAQQQELARLQRERGELHTALEQERSVAQAKLQAFEDAERKMREAFQAMAGEVLQQSSASFLDLAKARLDTAQAEAKTELETRKNAVEQLVKPLHESLSKLHEHVGAIENKRERAYGEISTQVSQLVSSQQNLQKETQNLVRALRAPAVRGRWGELQLKRVVELAGMLEYCDFEQQQSNTVEDGRLRPDLVVRLPGGKTIVVDAKTTLSAYLDSLETTDENLREQLLVDHARQVRTQLGKLSSKSYFEQQAVSPEFVVLFLPGETFFSAALQKDPALIEEGVGQRVLIATPTTLIALLRAVAYGWRQEKIAENAQEISATGRELYVRVLKFCEHLERVRKGLNSAVDAYNDAAGSLEKRVLPQARRFQELGASHSDELEPAAPIDSVARALQPSVHEEAGRLLAPRAPEALPPQT